MKSRFFKPGRGRIPLLQNRQWPPVGATSCGDRGGTRGVDPTRQRTFAPFRRSNPPSSQRGSALFVAVFLIAVVAVLAAAVALTSVTQQLGSARALQAEQAWYAAFGRIELEAPGMLAAGSCPGSGALDIAGFTTTFECSADEIDEGGATYSVFSVAATAQRGDAASGSLVRRTARAQFTNRN